MKRYMKIILILLISLVLVSLITFFAVFPCPPGGWTGPWPPWCEKPAVLGPFEYHDLDYIPAHDFQPKQGMVFGVGMADYWGNPHEFIDLGEDNRKLVDSSMLRLETIGSNALFLTDFVIYDSDLIIKPAKDLNAPGAIEISQDEMKRIVQSAKGHSQNMVLLTLNLYDPEYTYKKAFSMDTKDTAYVKAADYPDKTELLNKMFPQWETKMLEEAKKAQDAGVDAIIINPTDFAFEYWASIPELNERYKQLIPKVREKFSGEIGFAQAFRFAGDPSFTADDDVDFVLVQLDPNADYIQKDIFSDVKSEDLDDITSHFRTFLSQDGWKNIKSKKIYLSILIPSYDGSLKNGWIEPSIRDDSYTKDWKEQALGYEALFRAIYEGNYHIDGILSYGYWWSDQMYPVSKDLRNDLFHSIRQKDAENVFYRWSKILG
ncbi:MAG: hypothetical protein KKE20_06265 [Nanoarchaeota archaeon]|nr:hypothetical protein [Nanoarchaeota archaeon]